MAIASRPVLFNSHCGIFAGLVIAAVFLSAATHTEAQPRRAGFVPEIDANRVIRPDFRGKSYDGILSGTDSLFYFEQGPVDGLWKEIARQEWISNSSNLLNGKPFLVRIATPGSPGAWSFPAAGQVVKGRPEFAIDGDGDGTFDYLSPVVMLPIGLMMKQPVYRNVRDSTLLKILDGYEAALQGTLDGPAFSMLFDSLRQTVLNRVDAPQRDLIFLMQQALVLEDVWEPGMMMAIDSLVSRYDRVYPDRHAAIEFFRFQRIWEAGSVPHIQAAASAFYTEFFRFVPAKVFYIMFACPPHLKDFHRKKLLELHGTNPWVVRIHSKGWLD